nr:hypothetical protein [Tanacetum cinerariifolium]
MSGHVGSEHVGEEDVILHVGVLDTFLNKLVDGKCIRNEDVDANLGRNYTSLKVDELKYNGVDERLKVKDSELWCRRNDYRSIAVLYRRNVKEGRCSSQKGKQYDDDKGKHKVDEESKSKPDKWTKSKIKKLNSPMKGNPKSKGTHKSKGTPKQFMINVSIGQCKRTKQMAVYDHESGLIDHYEKLWDYIDKLLTIIPSFLVDLEVETLDGGKTVFRRMYICFTAFRRVIGLDGCFLSSTCRGELLTAMGRDSNNQMFPTAWGLEEAVIDLLPHGEHRMCVRHIYVNFKKKWTGLHYKTLLWGATTSSLEDIEKLKVKQRHWVVVVSGFQEFEVRKANDRFGVNLQQRTCTCKWWNLSSIPCVHVVAAYCFLNQDVVAGVSNWFIKQMWVNRYSYFIKPVGGSSMWFQSKNIPTLSPKKRNMPGPSAAPIAVDHNFTRLLQSVKQKINRVAKMTKAEKIAKESRKKDAKRFIEQANKMEVYRKRGVVGCRGLYDRIQNQRRKKQYLNGPEKQPETALDVSK